MSHSAQTHICPSTVMSRSTKESERFGTEAPGKWVFIVIIIVAVTPVWTQLCIISAYVRFRHTCINKVLTHTLCVSLSNERASLMSRISFTRCTDNKPGPVALTLLQCKHHHLVPHFERWCAFHLTRIKAISSP